MRTVSLEELLHRFGYRMEARKMELRQWLEEVQTSYAVIPKDVHDLKQYTIAKIASWISQIDTLEDQMQHQPTLI